MYKIFISGGDINGVGPELIIRTLNDFYINNYQISIICNQKIFNSYYDLLDFSMNFNFNIVEDPFSASEYKCGCLNFINIDVLDIKLNLGSIDQASGKLAGLSIRLGVKLAEYYQGALVTAPINKEALHLGGFHYPGHTEFIAELLESEDYLMILDGEDIRVALVTTHMAMEKVAFAIKKNDIIKKGKILVESLLNDYKKKSPRIVVTALNCHASDGGLFGSQEATDISPAVKELQEIYPNVQILGPLPADTAFTQDNVKKTDAFLVMYHDQGLIPLKLLSFGRGINFTAGLPIVRTSPDHGTAFDIAGKGIANIQSFQNALDKAIMFLDNRRRI